jgi:hypothetical protein
MCLFYTKQTKETKHFVVRRKAGEAPPGSLGWTIEGEHGEVHG